MGAPLFPYSISYPGPFWNHYVYGKLSFSPPESQTYKLLVRGQYFLHTHSGRILSKGAGARPCVRLSTQDTLLALSYGEDLEAWRASGVQDCTAPEARSWDVNAELCGAVSFFHRLLLLQLFKL